MNFALFVLGLWKLMLHVFELPRHLDSLQKRTSLKDSVSTISSIEAQILDSLAHIVLEDAFLENLSTSRPSHRVDLETVSEHQVEIA